jgi:hypothetical protein
VLGVGLDVGTGWSAVRQDALRVLESLAPWTSSASYLSKAYEAAARRGWSAASYDRLVRIRRSVDPNGLFVAPRATADDSRRARSQVAFKSPASTRLHRGRVNDDTFTEEA